MKLKDFPESRRDTVEKAVKAMTLGKRLALQYHGEDRIVEVHAVGMTRKGKSCMRVYQVIGGAVFGEEVGWKLLSLDDVDNVHILDLDSEGPRPGFKPGDAAMGAILAEISNVAVPAEAAP